jgi:NADH dehydrogenase [ubiquinone] 1 alpha subcomplex assembly factor 7
MSALADELKDLIAFEGPISIERFMALCLGHPRFGYYTTRDPFGPSGDFVTAPEVSQMFGELLGLWCADLWLQLGSPSPFQIIELGPGRGTLMADALRAMRVVPGLLGALEVHLVETSPVLRRRQRRTLAAVTPPLHWHAALGDVPQGPAVVLANEFFDALPVRQFVRQATGWHERLVGLSPDGGLVFGLAPGATPLAAPDAPPGTVVERAGLAAQILRELAQRLQRNGGAGLIIDYGSYPSAPGDTLQGLRAHQPVDPLSCPGETDLTVHVDFTALCRIAQRSGATVFGPTTQRAFLRALGIDQRAAALSAGAGAQARAAIAGALERLTGETAMGTLFKVLAIAAPGLRPSGFDSDASDAARSTGGAGERQAP